MKAHAQVAAAVLVERGLNDGLLAHDAELLYVRMGLRSKLVFKCHIVTPTGRVNI
jgi:hypothetical protein